MNNHMHFRHLLLLLLSMLILASCGTNESPRQETRADTSDAGMSVVESGGGLWQLTVTDRKGVPLRLRIRYSEFDDIYRTEGRDGGLTGPLLGNPEPKFASAADLRAMGRVPNETVHTFDPTSPPDSRWEEFDDVSVIHVHSGEMLIGRWKGPHITDIWYVGEFPNLLRERVTQHGESPCDAVVSLCCREDTVRLDGEELLMPRPVIVACYGAAMVCEDQAKRDALCPCMTRACFEVDINLPSDLSTPAAGCCVWGFYLCDGARAKPAKEALLRYVETFDKAPASLVSMAAIINRLTDEEPSLPLSE